MTHPRLTPTALLVGLALTAGCAAQNVSTSSFPSSGSCLVIPDRSESVGSAPALDSEPASAAGATPAPPHSRSAPAREPRSLDDLEDLSFIKLDWDWDGMFAALEGVVVVAVLESLVESEASTDTTKTEEAGLPDRSDI